MGGVSYPLGLVTQFTSSITYPVIYYLTEHGMMTLDKKVGATVFLRRCKDTQAHIRSLSTNCGLGRPYIRCKGAGGYRLFLGWSHVHQTTTFTDRSTGGSIIVYPLTFVDTCKAPANARL